jgi:serine/threonine-protein kinase
MLDPQASRFWQAALLSGLMDVEGLAACWTAIPPEKRDSPEHIDRRLARQALQAQALTLWQAQQLLAGRTSGFKVDRYLLLEMIGQGGMGRVYLARDTRLNRRVALKILAPERVNNPRAIARFQREARVGAQLQHENLVRVYDFGESNGRYFLVMEYIEGRTIGTLIAEQGPMPPATAARLVRQVALGLGHAHRKGLIHRDVNPYNILVTHDGTAKLADLGLAIDLAESDRVTREGATVGTFDYVAPEQARHSHAADIRSDIYSLGCTLYHMLAGQVPFPSPSLPEKLFAHQALEPTPLDQLAPGLPLGLAEVVRTMMRKAPEDRFAAPLLVAQALEPFADDSLGGAVRVEPARAQPRPEAQPRRPGDPRRAAAAGGTTERSPTPASPRSDEAEAVATPRVPAGPPPDAPAPKAAAQADGTAPRPGADADEAAIPLLTPVDEPATDAGEVPLLLDFGPEPSLSEAMTRPRSRFPSVFPLGSGSVFTPGGAGSDTSTSDGGAWWPAPAWLWGLVALAMFAAVLAVLIGLGGLLRPTSSSPPPQPDNPAQAQTSRDLEAAPPRARPVQDPESVVVCTEGHDEDPEEREVPYTDLIEAMQAALGSRGYVELRNRRPLRLDRGRALDLDSGRGRLVVRAAPGVVPVLELELDAGKPFLKTGSAVSLVLAGLAVTVRYPPGSASSPPGPSPLIRAAGTARIERCAFRAVAGPGPVDSRALVVEGGALTIERCWFEGFSRPIQVVAFHGTVASIRQTMIVPGSGSGPAPPAASGPRGRGWGLEVQIAPGGPPGAPRRLNLEHCTFEGAGLLDLAGGSVHSPLQVGVKHCAVWAEALLAWKPAAPDDRLADRLQWQGEGNLLDIPARSWIVPTAGPENPASSTAVVDQDTWSRSVARENEPIPSKLLYRVAPAARSNPLRPQDFAIAVSASDPADVGADPEQVGPWSR